MAPGIPTRYEIRHGATNQPQIEIWPEPDAAYPFRLEYYMRIGRFKEATDRVTVAPELVFLHALAAGKAHYRQKDADTIGTQLNALLLKYRGKQHKGRRYLGRGFSSAYRTDPDEVSPKLKRV